MKDNLEIIGSTTYIDIADSYFSVPAKIDTGADSTSIWASHIKISDSDELEFTLFDEGYEFYDGKLFKFKPGEYEIAPGRNSTGDKHYRYRIKIPIKIGKKRIIVAATLSDRSKNSMPVLIGRKTLNNKFLIDVSKNPTARKLSFKKQAIRLTEEMRKDPQTFHEKYGLGNTEDEDN